MIDYCKYCKNSDICKSKEDFETERKSIESFVQTHLKAPVSYVTTLRVSFTCNDFESQNLSKLR